MNLSAETLVISLVFVLPGFLANWLANYYSTAAVKQESAFEATLSSLAISTGVLFLQALVAAIALTILWFWCRSTFDHLELNKLVEEGLGTYFRAQPVLVAATVGGTALVSVACAFWIGYCDIIRKALRPRLTSLDLAEEEPWYMGLQAARQDLGKMHTFVELRMTSSGEVIRGVVRGFSLSPREDGTRDLILEAVKRKGADHSSDEAWSTDPVPGVTILNSRDFEDVRVVFTD